jgi:muramoyltetrapeptide carboxypeptidase
VPRDRFEAGLAILSSRYRVVYDEGLFERQGYLAGSDDRRIDELNRYLRSSDVRAILCARGGYGVMRILRHLDAEALVADPRPVVGFSDLTALLSWCVLDGRVRPIHGPHVTQLGELPPEDVAHFFRTLEEPYPVGVVARDLTPVGFRGAGAVEGVLVGGNLEMVSRLCGTPWQLDLGAGVFFAEDVGERPYRVDRTLTQLELAGALDGVRAVVLGPFIRCEEPGGAGPTVDEVLDERLRAVDLPGLAGVPAGHGNRNVALPIGARCVADLTDGRLAIEDPAVS